MGNVAACRRFGLAVRYVAFGPPENRNATRAFFSLQPALKRVIVHSSRSSSSTVATPASTKLMTVSQFFDTLVSHADPFRNTRPRIDKLRGIHSFRHVDS